ncbi:LytTR family DNA-binding domain-containing protein [Aquiflexum gelatinilyticum]|uniref:LytTR family DNA-binding domain-containing protein n=1 Tax=Aquiflexum gelatinilyticum TaxID=2961943 RepID=UPI00216A20F2|nr:LytTR family transcriptional regulator [Aquiflexum gelatinilyticum]MCS4433416.1 LytTR family transcriptional regulator [Aquiflexum gelatinilyticum]
MNSLLKMFVFSILTGFFFVAIGQDISLFVLFGRWEFYFDWFCVVLIVFLVTYLMSRINTYLERKYPWNSDFKKRLLLQFLFNVLLVTGVSFFLVFVYMEFVLCLSIVETSYFEYELPISIVVILVINLIFVIQYFVDKEKSAVSRENAVVMPQKIIGFSGKSRIAIDPTRIIYIEKEGSISFLYLESGDRYVYYGTLEELESKLAPNNFFRSNRQTIVHRDNCMGYDTERSGQVNLTLKIPHQKQVKISQKKAKDFKNWLLE